MSDNSDEHGAEDSADIIRFPQSRTTPVSSAGGYKELGIGAMAKHLNMRQSQMTGHWCSRCVGMWFGYAFEVECPQCGNRHG